MHLKVCSLPSRDAHLDIANLPRMLSSSTFWKISNFNLKGNKEREQKYSRI